MPMPLQERKQMSEVEIPACNCPPGTLMLHCPTVQAVIIAALWDMYPECPVVDCDGFITDTKRAILHEDTDGNFTPIDPQTIDVTCTKGHTSEVDAQ